MNHCQPFVSWSPLIKLETYRHQMIVNLYQRHPDTLSALTIAMVWGDTTYLSDTIKEDYQILGLVHLLAISGSHIIVLLMLMTKVLDKFIAIRWLEKAVKYSLLLTYMILAGQHIPIVRAVCMVIMLDIAKKLNITKFDSLNILVIGNLIFNYRMLFDVGFQLSFMITYTLILFNHRIKSLHNNIMKSLYVIFLCQIVTLPLTINYFHTISVAGIIANLLYLPFFTMILFPIMLFLALCYMLSSSLFSIAHGICQIVIVLNDSFINFLRLILFEQLIVGAWPSISVVILSMLVLYLLYVLDNACYRYVVRIVMIIIL